MKKEVRFGSIHIESDHSEKFIDAGHALMAMQTLQAWMAIQGYLTASTLNIPSGTMQVTVHFDGKPLPVLPAAYKYTWKDINSHEYWNEYKKKSERVRCIDFYFEFKH